MQAALHLQDPESSSLPSPGRNYGQPAPAPEVGFRSDLATEFEDYLENSTNHSIFTDHKRQQFIQYLEHPSKTLTTLANSAAERACEANARQFCFRYFEVDNGCLYRSAKFKTGEDRQLVEIPRRYVALNHNAFKFITDIHGDKYLLTLDMQVQATDIVKQAYQSKHLPHDPFPIEQLSGAVRKPNLQELSAISNLQHMMWCVERVAPPLAKETGN